MQNIMDLWLRSLYNVLIKRNQEGGAMPSTGDRIREIREKRGMKQDQLSKEAGISKGFLSDVENNNANVSSQTLLKIANCLGASVDYLLRGDTVETFRNDTPVVIPPELAGAAESLHLRYSETVELLNVHNSVVARRSNKSVRSFTIDDWKELYKSIKKVYGSKER